MEVNGCIFAGHMGDIQYTNLHYRDSIVPEEFWLHVLAESFKYG